MTPDLAITCAIVAAPIIGLYAVARQRDNLRALRAEARLDLIHDQHVEAGKMAHEAERTKRAETTRALALSIGRPDLAARISHPLDAGPCSHPADSTAGEADASPAFVPRSGSAALPPVDLPKKKGA